MSVREENLRCMRDICDVLDETLDAFQHEIMKAKEKVRHLRSGIEVESQLGRVVDPLKAPEIIGADRNGDGGVNV